MLDPGLMEDPAQIRASIENYAGFFSTGKKLNALGLHDRSKTQDCVRQVIEGDMDWYYSQPSMAKTSVAKALGLHVYLLTGITEPYPADVHKSIVKEMLIGPTLFRKAVRRLGLNGLRAAGSVATDEAACRAVVAACAKSYPSYQALPLYIQELEKYLSE